MHHPEPRTELLRLAAASISSPGESHWLRHQKSAVYFWRFPRILAVSANAVDALDNGSGWARYPFQGAKAQPWHRDSSRLRELIRTAVSPRSLSI